VKNLETDRITEWFRQLYRDLDDRHLLLPVIGLLVAIVAVPLLLGGGSSDTATTSPATATDVAPASMSGAEEVDPVVLADVPGLRDYRKRLDQFHAHNPFEQQMTGGKGGANGKGGGGNGGSSSTGTGSTGSTDTGSSTAGGTDGGSSGAPPDTGDTGGGETKLVFITLDVKVGRPGEAKVLEDVMPLDFLPGKQRPIVQYVQGDLNATKAAFVVSPDVVSTDGDGRCKPRPKDCQFLLMHEGDEQFFEYGDKLKKYKLQILDIRRKVVEAKNAEELGEDAREASKATVDFVAHLDG